MLTHRLEIEAPSQKRWVLAVDRPRLTLGRAPTCDVPLAGKLVSARHAELFQVGAQLRIRDLASTNGLFVNGVRRGEGVLQPGDHVRLGDCVLVVLEPIAGPRAEPAAPPAERPNEATDRTVIDPFAIKLSLEGLASGIGADAGAGPTGQFIRQKLELLYRLGQDVNHVESLEAWLERVARLVREMIGPERLAVLLFDAPTAPGAPRVGRTALARDWTQANADRPVYVPPAFVAQVIDEQKAILIQATTFEPRFRRDPRIEEERIVMVMGAPLLVARGVTGLLYLDRTTPQPLFSPDDLQLLGVIANQCSVMLENVRLFAEVRRTLEELKTTQAQLIQAAKLSSLGELVAGIAHEINNPLSAVLGYAQLLLADEALGETTQRDVKRISEQAVRVKRIVEQLLIFVRRSASATSEQLDLNEIVAASLEFKAYDLRAHRIAVTTSYDPALPPVACVRSEIQQVLINILHNADQALASRGAGSLAISTRLAGERAEVRLADDGPGIPPEVLPKIFDPFFTTKPVGQGTGLGLSISYGIVKRHGGEIRVETEVGKGTAFIVSLPVGAPASAAPATEPPLEERRAAAAAGPRRHVLVVEDEEAIRDVAATYLTRAGFLVTLAGSEPEVVEALASGQRFDALVSDLRIPGTSGLKVYDLVVAREPSLERRVVFITGDVANPAHTEVESRFPGALLPKPFDLAELEARILALFADGRA
jgi:signal transduction histidine kinase/CheY-like chemotaxis protein